MRTLGDIFAESKSKRTILFEEEKWCIYRRPKVIETGCVLILIHRCKACTYVDAMESPRKQIDACSSCGETTPDDIKTLYILSTWDQT